MTPLPWHRELFERLLAARERLPHALLLHGRTGIGKREFARAFAASALCESPRDAYACQACVSCHWFSQGNHPDFREVVPEATAEDEEGGAEEAADAGKDKAKSLVIKIEQVRAVGDFVTLTTHRAGYRVLVFRPAESLHPNAANALLKTLEEPPRATLILLVSDRPSRLLPTIRSRCRHVALPLPARDAALAWLREADVPQPEVALASAGGAPLFARDLADPAETELRKRLLGELAKPSGADPGGFPASLERANVERAIHWMQTWVHDLVRVRMGAGVRHHPDFAGPLRGRAQDADLGALFDLDRELAEARRLAAHPLNPRLLAEHLLMAYNRATSGSRP